MTANSRLAAATQTSYLCSPSCGGQTINSITTCSHQPWNKGKLVGQKALRLLKDIWATHIRLDCTENTRFSLNNEAVDYKQLACSLTTIGRGNIQVRHLGIEVDDALDMPEQAEV